MKKYILIILLFTGFLQAQTYPVNPTKFGKISLNTNIEDNSITKLSAQSSNNEINWIQPINVPILFMPSNYSAPTQTIGNHLSGIDTRLGQISSTSAGLTQRVWFTADNTTVTAGTFFASNPLGKGATATGSPSALVLGDNVKAYFNKDLISGAQPSTTIGYAGTYSGNLTVSATPTPNATFQRFTLEVYRCNNGGTPIASGVTGAPTGDLGVTVIAILDSGQINLVAGAITNVPIAGILTQNITINTGERLRYHVSAQKVGIGGGNVTFGVYYGSSYNSYYDVPVAITTDAVLNKSVVSGVTATDALNSLNTNKENTANKQNSLAIDGTGVKFPTVDIINTVTAFVSPNQFTGTDTQKIQAALNFAVANNKILRINRNASTGLDIWDIDTAILLKSNTKIIIDNVALKLTNSSRDNIFRTENAGLGLTTPSSNPLNNISIVGIGNAILQGADNPRSTGDINKTLSASGSGANFSYGSDAGVGGQTQVGDWRNIGILMGYTTNITISGLKYINMHAWANSFERCKNINLNNLVFSTVRDRTISGVGTVSCKNMDGIDFRLGCSIINVNNISGFTDDDTVACTLLSVGAFTPGVYGAMEVTGSVYGGSGDDLHDIYINNINSATRENNVRLLNTGATKLYNVTIENIRDTSASAIQAGFTIILGSNNPVYGGTSPLGNFNNINIRNVTNRFAVNAINLANFISESSISNIYQPNGTALSLITGNRQLSVSNIIINTPTTGIAPVELIASSINATAIRSGLFSDANNLSYLANMAWLVSTEVNLDNYQYSGFYLTPASGLINLPSGWAQQRYSMITIGNNSNTFRGQILFNSATNDMAYRTSPSGGTFNAWAVIPRIVTNTTTTVFTSAALTAAYPGVSPGFKVHCISIIAGALIYEKTSTGWIQYSVTVVL